MKVMSRGTCLALALALLIVGFSNPLPAEDKTVPQSSNDGAVVPLPPPVKETAPAEAGSASLRVSGAAFRPRSSIVTFDHYWSGSMYATANPSIWWTAPVDLPQGSVVTSVRMFYRDTDTTYDCDGVFTVYDFATLAIFHEWFTSSSGSSSSVGYADTAAINHTIDYSKYAYILHWRPNVTGSTMALVGFQIFYTPPAGQNKVVVIPLD